MQFVQRESIGKPAMFMDHPPPVPEQYILGLCVDKFFGIRFCARFEKQKLWE